MAVTLKMIAEKAGLSQSTVSQILNRKPNDLSSAETKKRVFEIAAALGYKQKFGHKVLRGDHTQTVAILLGIKRLADEEHIRDLILELLDNLEYHGYSSYVLSMRTDIQKNKELINDLCARGVEHFIFIGEPVGRMEITQEICNAGRTIIGYGANFHRDIKVSTQSATLALLKFFQAEKRHDFKMLIRTDFAKSERFKALQELFPDLTTDELIRRYVIIMDFEDGDENSDIDLQAEIGCRETMNLLKQFPDVSALLYLNDYFAIGGVHALQELGKIPGKDILVAGFNNIFAVRNSFLPISSTVHPIREIARELIKNLNGRENLKTILSQETIIRTQPKQGGKAL